MKNWIPQPKVRIALAAGAITTLAAISVPVQALTFDEIVAQLEATVVVQEGRVDREVAENRQALSEFAGDPRLTLSPSTSWTGAEGDWSPEETVIRGSLTAEIPLGLSRTAQNSASAQREAEVSDDAKVVGRSHETDSDRRPRRLSRQECAAVAKI